MLDIQELLKNFQNLGGVGGAMDGAAPPAAAPQAPPPPAMGGAEERIGRGLSSMPPPQASPFNWQEMGKNFGTNLGKGISQQYGLGAQQQRPQQRAPAPPAPQPYGPNPAAVQALRGSAPAPGTQQSPFSVDPSMSPGMQQRRGIWGA